MQFKYIYITFKSKYFMRMAGWIYGCLDTVFKIGVCSGLHFLYIQVLQTLTLLCEFLE